MGKNRGKNRHGKRGAAPPPSAVPKVIGSDIELGCCVVGLNRSGGTGYVASQVLLREMPGAANPEDYDPDDDGQVEVEPLPDDEYTTSNGYSGNGGYSTSVSTYGQGGYSSGYGYGYGSNYSGAWSGTVRSTYNPQDWGRKWLPNGGCTYIDLGHLELCAPEVISAFEHVGAWHGMLRITQLAQQRAQAKLPSGQSLEVLVNNSDGRGNSYGSHTNFLITRRCMDNIATRKLHYTLFLASHFASSIVYTGAGKVGSEDGPKYSGYQLAQRADFYKTITGVQTTHNRPIVNLRDEPLCGRVGWDNSDSSSARSYLARMHVIFFDNTLCHVSTMLKMGVTQIVLAMIEQEQVDPSLILDSPLSALRRWSRDPDCRALAALADGRKRTAVEFQQELYALAKVFIDSGRADGIVPRAREIVDIWGQTLEELRTWDVDALVGKLDHMLKRSLLEDIMSQRGLDWESDDIRYLDQTYGSLKPSGGLYRLYEDQSVQKVVPDELIERLAHEPPADTRAYLRGNIVRLVDDEAMTSMDWDNVRLKFTDSDASTSWSSDTNYVLSMADPLAFTEARCGRALASGRPVREMLEDLGMVESTWSGQPLDCDDDTASTSEGGNVVLVRDISRVGLYDNNANTPNEKGGETK